MSTPPQYDPEKPNAWTRDLPSARPRPIALQVEAFQIERNAKLRDIEVAARAVIAAGRPHPIEPNIPPDGEWHSTKSHTCPQCAAWDALAELLKAG